MSKITLSREDLAKIKLPLSKTDYQRLKESDWESHERDMPNKLAVEFLTMLEDERFEKTNCAYNEL